MKVNRTRFLLLRRTLNVSLGRVSRALGGSAVHLDDLAVISQNPSAPGNLVLV